MNNRELKKYAARIVTEDSLKDNFFSKKRWWHSSDISEATLYDTEEEAHKAVKRWHNTTKYGYEQQRGKKRTLEDLEKFYAVFPVKITFELED